MMQPSLDFTADYPPHQRYSDTSRASAAQIAPKFSARLRSMLEIFSRHASYGLTDEEGQASLDMEGNSYRPARVTLASKGMISDSGLRRKTKSGRSAAVWTITAKGKDAINGF